MTRLFSCKLQHHTMKILHNITFTINRVEHTARLTRRRRLTCAGAQRIIRRVAREAIVTRIDTMVDAR